MRRVRRMLRSLGVTLPALALFGIGVDAARAACTVDPCVGGGSALFDCDRDGYTDAEECNGLVAGTAAFSFPSCRSGPQPSCLDPARADVFVLFQKAPGSIYDQLGLTPQQAFAPITQTGSGGLAQRLHVLDAATTTLLPLQGGRAVTARQSALLVREILTPPSTSCPVTAYLGLTPGGGAAPSLNNAKEAQVYTQRIVDHVSCVYTAGGASPTSLAATADKIKMIQHTTSHELTHNGRVAPDFVERFGGHHYRTGTGCVMDQSVTYSTTKGVKFNTSTVYCGPDQSATLDGRTALGALHCEDPDDLIDQDGFTIECLPATP